MYNINTIHYKTKYNKLTIQYKWQMAPDITERLKASAYHQLCIPYTALTIYPCQIRVHQR